MMGVVRLARTALVTTMDPQPRFTIVFPTHHYRALLARFGLTAARALR
jgi:hypothetical protein